MVKNVKRKKKRNRRGAETRQNKYTMIAISFVVCMLFGILLYGGNDLQKRIEDNNEKIETLESGIAEQERRTDDIVEMGEEMQSEEFVERTAQEKLGLVKDNQIILKPEKE